MRQLIVRGLGAGFLPTLVVADDIAAGRLVSLPLSDADGLVRTIALVSHDASGLLPPAAREFANAVQAEAEAAGLL